MRYIIDYRGGERLGDLGVGRHCMLILSIPVPRCLVYETWQRCLLQIMTWTERLAHQKGLLSREAFRVVAPLSSTTA